VEGSQRRSAHLRVAVMGEVGVVQVQRSAARRRAWRETERAERARGEASRRGGPPLWLVLLMGHEYRTNRNGQNDLLFHFCSQGHIFCKYF
jgi:hypothetical protein